MHLCSCVLKVRGQYWVSFSIMLGFIFQSRIFHWAPASSLIWLGWLLCNPQGVTCLHPQHWHHSCAGPDVDFSMAAGHAHTDSVFGWQTLSHLSPLSSFPLPLLRPTCRIFSWGTNCGRKSPRMKWELHGMNTLWMAFQLQHHKEKTACIIYLVTHNTQVYHFLFCVQMFLFIVCYY